jgi:hypothetical protein
MGNRMLKITNQAFGALAAAILGAAVVAIPSAATWAGPTAREYLAQSTSPQAAPGQLFQLASGQATHRQTTGDPVEAQIKSLRDRLRITPAQQPQWEAVAQVMRDNAKTFNGLVRERAQAARGMSAVDDLRSYQKIADAQADGLNKLVPPFEALYDSMSADQKKNADSIFGHSHRQTAAKSG